MNVDATITKTGGILMVSHIGSKAQTLDEFAAYLATLKNIRDGIGLRLISKEDVPTTSLVIILEGAAKNPSIKVLDIRLGNIGRAELERREKLNVERPGAGQPATKPADKVPAEVQHSTQPSKDAQ